MKKSTNNKFSDKNFNTLNLKDCKEKAFYSNKKQKKISKLLHINLNPKFIDGNSPSNTLYVTKKTNEEIFSSTSYINKINIQNKKIENKTSKSLNKFENFVKGRINNTIAIKTLINLHPAIPSAVLIASLVLISYLAIIGKRQNTII